MPSKSREVQEKPVAEVMPQPRGLSVEQRRGLGSFDEALRLAQEQFGTVERAADVIGDGFAIATEEDERRLCGVPLIFMEWDFRAGDFGAYVSAVVVAQTAPGAIAKYIINDGSTGICMQLDDYTKQTGRSGGLLVRNGLRVSDYMIDPETKTAVGKDSMQDGVKYQPAHTFYLDTSA